MLVRDLHGKLKIINRSDFEDEKTYLQYLFTLNYQKLNYISDNKINIIKVSKECHSDNIIKKFIQS